MKNTNTIPITLLALFVIREHEAKGCCGGRIFTAAMEFAKSDKSPLVDVCHVSKAIDQINKACIF